MLFYFDIVQKKSEKMIVTGFWYTRDDHDHDDDENNSNHINPNTQEYTLYHHFLFRALRALTHIKSVQIQKKERGGWGQESETEIQKKKDER